MNVANMKNNLLGLEQLLEKGYSMNMIMENSQMKVFDDIRRLILKAFFSKNRTLKMRIQIMEDQCLVTTISDKTWVCHHRLGHLNLES